MTQVSASPSHNNAAAPLRSLRTRLLSAFLLTVVLLGLATGVGSGIVAYRSGRTQIREQLNAIAILKEWEIDAWVEALQRDLLVELNRNRAARRIATLLSAAPDSPAYREAYAEQSLRFRETIRLRQTFHEIFLLNAEGVVVLASDPTIEGNIWDWVPFFKAGLEEPGVHVQALSYSGVTADLNTVVAVHPIHADDGTTIGVLAGRASLDPLNELMLERTGLGDSGETYLVGSNQVLLTPSRFSGYQQGQIRIETDVTREAIQQKGHGFSLHDDYRGVPVVAAYRWLPHLQVVLIAEQDQQEAFAPTYTTIQINLALTAVAILIVGVVGGLITRNIAVPLMTLSETARRIAAGDLKLVAQVQRRDEIGELATAFNYMTGRLREMLRREEARATELEREIVQRKLAEREREHLLSRVQAQAHQVQAQARQVQEIITTVPEGVLLLDDRGRVIQANPLGISDIETLAGAKIGDTLEQLGGQTLERLLDSPPKGLWHSLESAGRHFQILARPIEMVSAKMVGFDALCSGDDPLSDIESRFAGWVLVIRDVTQQQKMEERAQQQERLAAVGQLAAGIAHDFNNIMATIVLYAQMVARSPDISGRDQERVLLINQQAQHAARLIQQILDFSRRAVLEMHPLNLLPLFKEQIKLLKRTLPENIHLTLAHGRDDYVIHGDPTRIQQIIVNLAVNARDAMPQGGELWIILERLDFSAQDPLPMPEMQRGPWIQLTVEDTGVGIPDDVLPHIFEPFFTTKEPGKGTGLGLAQVHGIVGAHAGHITVESAAGQGTTFTIYLPALKSREDDAPSKAPGAASSLPPGHGETVLVVEDNEATRKAVMESLRELNYRVITATQGREALAVLAHRSVDLVLSDVVMPEMGGEALLQILHARGHTLPVVLMSGHPLENARSGLDDEASVALLAGWIAKPPTLEQLAQTIARALREAASEPKPTADS